MHLTSDKKIFVPDDEDWYKWGAAYEQDEFDEVIEHISKRDVALDIGAHVGIWTKRLAEKFEHVYCFEPVPKHIECWHANVTNDFSNVDIEDVALGHENGTATMKVPNTTNTGMASLVHEIFNQRTGARWVQPGWDKFPEIEVETRTLDSYEFDQLDFMKIDVEWFEYRVIEGALSTIQKFKPIIYIECHDINVYPLLLSLGYKSILAHSVNRLFKIIQKM